jgi:ABC-type spermidine/putrescine transport system permease subunit II
MRTPWRLWRGLARAPLTAYALLAYAFLFFPSVVIILFSFNQSKVTVWPPRGFTLDWYGEILRDPTLLESIANSLIVASLATIGSVILGTMAAIALSRYHFRGKRLVYAAMLAPIALPGLVTGIAMLSYFEYVGLQRSLVTVILAHIVFTLPFVVTIVIARLSNFDAAVEEAALDLGASPLRSFLTVTLPIIAPSVAGAALVVFALSFDEFIITFFVIGNQSTLPLKIWSMMRLGIAPTINAVASIIIVLSTILVLIGTRFVRVAGR